MNRIIATIALGLAFASVFSGCKSQYASDKPDPYVDYARADLRNQRRQIFDQALRLSTAEASAFWPVYDEYEKESKKLGDQRLQLMQQYAKNYDSMSNDVAHDLMRQALDQDSRRVDLRTRYAKRVEDATSAVTAARFVQIDNRLQLVVDAELMSMLPPLPKPAQK